MKTIIILSGIFVAQLFFCQMESSAQSHSGGPGLFYGYAGLTMAKISTSADFAITGDYVPESNTTLSLENDLGFPSTSPLLYLKVLAGGRLQFAGSFYSLHRNGDAYLSRVFSFGDQSYNVGAQVKGYFNTDYYSATLRLSLIRNPLATAGFSLGGRYLKMKAGIDASSGGSTYSQNDSYDIPFVVPGVHASIYALPKFLIRGSIEYFELKVFGTKGKAIDGQITAEYFLLKYLGVGVGYSYLELRGTGIPENNIYLKNVTYTQKGLNVFAAFRF